MEQEVAAEPHRLCHRTGALRRLNKDLRGVRFGELCLFRMHSRHAGVEPIALSSF